MLSADDIRLLYPDNGYVAYHAPRYASLLALLERYTGDDPRILDVGRTTLTELIADQFNRPIDSLGFGDDAKHDDGSHYRFDLNDAVDQAQWRSDLPAYDAIVMAEVIEHLHTAPVFALRFLRTLLTPQGVLVIQTPNAVVLHKRVQMLLGRNPFEKIREDTTNPGHFREYTRRELLALAQQSGYLAMESRSGNYFDYRFTDHRGNRVQPRASLKLVNMIYAVLPGCLKPGITLVLQNEP